MLFHFPPFQCKSFSVQIICLKPLQNSLHETFSNCCCVSKLRCVRTFVCCGCIVFLHKNLDEKCANCGGKRQRNACICASYLWKLCFGGTCLNIWGLFTLVSVNIIQRSSFATCIIHLPHFCAKVLGLESWVWSCRSVVWKSFVYSHV